MSLAVVFQNEKLNLLYHSFAYLYVIARSVISDGRSQFPKVIFNLAIVWHKTTGTNIVAHCYYTIVPYLILLISIARYPGIYWHASGPCCKTKVRGQSFKWDHFHCFCISVWHSCFSASIGDRYSRRESRENVPQKYSCKTIHVIFSVGSTTSLFLLYS